MGDGNQDDNILAQIHRGIGRLEGRFDGLEDHVKSVSNKAGEVGRKLDKHIDDDGAHGVGVKEKVGVNIERIVLLLVAVLGLGAAVWQAASSSPDRGRDRRRGYESRNLTEVTPP